MKLLWTGSDAYFMNDLSKRKLRKRPYWIVMRLIVKFLDFSHIECHLVNAQWIKEELIQFGLKRPIEIMLTPLKYTEKVDKIWHDKPCVMYYKPPRAEGRWRDWLYGIDLIDRLVSEYKEEVCFIELDQSMDMNKVFPIVDLYIRPNRHDGYSRLIRECDIQGIPYYWSHKDPNYEEMSAKVDQIIEQFYNK